MRAEDEGFHDCLSWELSHTDSWKTDSLLWQASLPDLFGVTNLESRVPTYVNGNPAGRWRASVARTPTPGRSLQTTGWGKELCSGRGILLSEAWTHTLQFSENDQIFMTIHFHTYSEVAYQYKNLKRKYLYLTDIDRTISRPLECQTNPRLRWSPLPEASWGP